MRRSVHFLICAFFLIAGSVLVFSFMQKKSNPKSNQLIHEKSPYLLQHAYNPVDWYPWGEAAFKKARVEDKPIFLSIGYSTCHWCHVMEHESFENEFIADLLNESYISIKVDREERPDIDQIYMQAVTAMTGSGGWPMSVFLTPDLKPFYGGTYFPPIDKWGRPGFATVLNAIREKWKAERAGVLHAAEDLTRALQEGLPKRMEVSAALDEATLTACFKQLEAQFDSELGGFSNAPKFPRSHTLSWLLRYSKRMKEKRALLMVEKTLSEMTKGGLCDHLGGGFHRYSTDRKWHIPHFEKMLYDQAILTRTYLEAYQTTQSEDYAGVVRETFDYVLRDLKDTKGSFYSAEDADSLETGETSGENKEGAFYVWTQNELIEHLGNERAKVAAYYFGVEESGNAEEDPHGEFTGKNILYVSRSVRETAAHFKMSEEAVEKLLNESKKILFEKRKLRHRPHLDDKTLTDWNGLMISSLAFGSRVLNEDRYLEAAEEAAQFILKIMKRQDGRLMHRYRDGEVKIEGFLEDYAFFSNSLIDLYEASFDPQYLKEAKFLAEEMIRLFWDETSGGFFLAAKDSEKLIAQSKEIYDGAIYSGNSIATLVLLRLGRMFMSEFFTNHAMNTLKHFSEQIEAYPSGFTQMLIALDFLLGPSQEIVLAGNPNSKEANQFVQELYRSFIPNRVLIFHSNQGPEKDTIEQLIPFVKSQAEINQRLTAYVCENYSCKLPINDLSELKSLLEGSK